MSHTYLCKCNFRKSRICNTY